MRGRIIRELGDLTHSSFLTYVMGPYQAFDVGEVLKGATSGEFDPTSIPASVEFSQLVGTDVDVAHDEVIIDLLLDVRDELRTNPGVNAFLAIDIDVSLDELDAATQSVAFAEASNVVVYIVPAIGDNLGVGIEIGAVLEAIFQENSQDAHHERVFLAYESGVSSAMLASVQVRWDARSYEYTDRGDLIDAIRRFVRDIARRELAGDLPRLGVK